MLALLEDMSSAPAAQTGRRPMPDPLDDVRYYAGRIPIVEAQTAEIICLAARHAHEKLATLYRSGSMPFFRPRSNPTFMRSVAHDGTA
jgi:hypothetical protein